MGPKGANFGQVSAEMSSQRMLFLENAKAMRGVQLTQHKLIPSTELFTKKLMDQKVGLGEAITNFKEFNRVAQQQLNFRKAMAVSISRDSSGRDITDFLVPEGGFRKMDMMRAKLSAFGAGLASVGDNMIKVGKNTQWAGRQLTVGFSVPLSIAGAATGKLAYDVDKALTQITKVYGDANDSMQDSVEMIREQSWQTAKNMSNIYGQSAKDTLEITSQFAAAGATGVELQNAAAAATKARMLNEIDLQTAIDASITMQTVYGYTAEELGHKWDYINAIANQTILGAEDFATAIPKVAGLIKDLGGDLEDLGVLMTAMRAAGISAAEGANALKTISFRSVAPFERSLKTFRQMTGRELEDIIAQTNGEVIPTLEAIGKAMDGLSKPEKTRLIKDLFGVYQGNKGLNLLNQLLDKSDQVAQALAVGDNSVAENAAIAAQELRRMNDQPYKVIEKALQNIKNSMVEIGAVVLPMVAVLAEWIEGIVGAIAGLDDGTKKTLAVIGALTAGIGPLIMLVGLFNNLFGYIVRTPGLMMKMLAAMKLMSREDAARKAMAIEGALGWNQQTDAVNNLTMAVQNYHRALMQVTGVQEQIFNRRGFVYDEFNEPVINKKTGVQQGVITTRGWRDVNTGDFFDEDQVNKIIDLQDETAAADKAMKKAGMSAAQIGQNIAGATMMASLLVQTMTDNKWANVTSQVAGGLSMMALMFPSIITRTVEWAKGVTVLQRSMAAVQGTVSNINWGLKGAVGPAFALGSALVWVYTQAKKTADEAAASMKALGESADTWATILGYNQLDPTQIAKEAGMSARKITQLLSQDMREENEELYNYFSDQSARDIGDKWAIAVNEGFKVKLSGGTEEAAIQAIRVALNVMGEGLTDEEFDMQIKANFDFSDTKEQIESVTRNLVRAAEEAAADEGTGWEKFWRVQVGKQQMVTDAQKQIAVNTAREWADAFLLANEKEQARMTEEAYKQVMDSLREIYERTNKDISFQDFITAGMRGDDYALKGLSGKEFVAASRQFDFLNLLNEELIKTISLGDVAADKIDEVFAALMQRSGLQLTESQLQDYNAALRMAARSGHALSLSEQMLLRNEIALYGSADAAGDSIASMGEEMDDAADKVDRLQEYLDKLGIQLTSSEVESTWRNMMQGAQSAMFDAALDSFDRMVDRGQDAIDAEADAAMENFERRSDALDQLYDRKEKALSKSQEARGEAFEKRWDARIDKETALYDKHIENIENAIDAEKKAQDMREKLYERERTRLQRLADLYNSSVDVNVAIQTGDLDEAVRLTNNMAATQAGWATEDSIEVTKSASEQQVEALEKSKELIEEEKKTRLNALEEVRKAEKKAMDERFDLEKEALKRQQDGAKRSLEIQKKASQDNFNAKKEGHKREWEDRKRSLQIELESIKAHIPTTQAQYEEQSRKIAKVYRDHGYTLEGYGREWSGEIARFMTNAVTRSGVELKSAAEWKDIGAEISKGIMQGAFGMTPAQFHQWLNGGKPPTGSIFSETYKAHVAKKPTIYDGKSTVRGVQVFHTGGIIGDRGRMTTSMDKLRKGEVPFVGLTGEAVLNREATRKIGPKAIAEMNSGRFPKDTGPWDTSNWGFAGIGGAIAGGIMRATVHDILRAVVARKAKDYGKTVKLPPALFGKSNLESLINPTTGSAGAYVPDAGNVGTGIMSGDWFKPMKGYRVSSEFGNRWHPIDKVWRLHAGIDLAGPTGSPIYAARGGRVALARYSGGRGNLTVISHGNGLATNYAHQSAFAVKEGQIVKGGQYIGRVGTTGKSTGPHLHFEFTRNGQFLNPRQIIPQFAEGGHIWRGGVARLHDDETVLSQPLSDKLHQGLDRFANGYETVYNVNVDMRNSTFKDDIDVQNAVEKALMNVERKRGRSRIIGGKK